MPPLVFRVRPPSERPGGQNARLRRLLRGPHRRLLQGQVCLGRAGAAFAARRLDGPRDVCDRRQRRRFQQGSQRLHRRQEPPSVRRVQHRPGGDGSSRLRHRRSSRQDEEGRRPQLRLDRGGHSLAGPERDGRGSGLSAHFSRRRRNGRADSGALPGREKGGPAVDDGEDRRARRRPQGRRAAPRLPVCGHGFRVRRARAVRIERIVDSRHSQRRTLPPDPSGPLGHSAGRGGRPGRLWRPVGFVGFRQGRKLQGSGCQSRGRPGRGRPGPRRPGS